MPADSPRRAPARETSLLGELWPHCLKRHVLRGVSENRSGSVAVDAADRQLQRHPREVGTTKTDVNASHYSYVLNIFSFEVALVVQVVIVAVDEYA